MKTKKGTGNNENVLFFSTLRLYSKLSENMKRGASASGKSVYTIKYS